MERLNKILEPRSVAVIGASDDLGKVGGRAVYLLRHNSFPGAVFPINPKRDRIQGLPCFPSIATVGQTVDLCVIAVSAADVDAQVRQCLDAGVGGLIVLSSGYAEQDAVGARRQAELTELVATYKVPMIGPNCLGVMNGNNGLVASSTFSINDRKLLGGKLSFATQSGAIGTYWLDAVLDAGFGIAKWVSTGNGADVDLAEVLDYLVDDEETSVIGLYVEGIRNGALFRSAAIKALAKKKPVLILKAGRSSIGAAAAASHTGSLAGEDSLYQAFFEQYGICRVESLSEMLDISRIVLTQPLQPGRRTCVVSVSGGAGVLVTDAAIANGLDVPELSSTVKTLLKAMLPEFATPQNPLDITAHVATEPTLLGRVLRVMVDSGEFDQMVVFCGALGNLQRELSESMIAGIAGWDRPCVVIWQANRPLAAKLLANAGLPVFTEIPPAVAALARLTHMAGHWHTPLPEESSLPFQAYSARHLKTALTEHGSKAFLEQRAGLKRPRGVLVRAASDVASAIESLRSPFAVKLQSPQLVHKSGSGGIALGVAGALEITRVVAGMLDLASSRELKCEGVLIEEMQPIQFEFLVGLRRDPTLGTVLVMGRGGVSVEVDPDVVRIFLPVSPDQITALLGRLRTSRLYSGFRGKAAAPLAEIARVIASLAAMFQADDSIREVEINPLVCDDRGGVVAVDASVWLEEPINPTSR